jgi:DNA-binding beta-propeller fold protein YncE
MSASRHLWTGILALLLFTPELKLAPTYESESHVGPTFRSGVANLAAQTAGVIPKFEYDPTWPKLPLPNQWIFGEVGGIGVDPKGHIWVIHRPWTVNGRELAAVTGDGECCRPAPSVIEFDQEGNVVQAWPQLQKFKAPPGTSVGQGVQPVGRGGEELWEAAPGPYGEWGRREHTVLVDHKDFVWISNDESHVIYKFTRAGKHILTIGKHNITKGSNDTEHLGRPAGLAVDPQSNQLFVADGYTNKRVIVFDADSGKYLRHWGAYGSRPDDANLGPYDPKSPPAKQFRGPVHGIVISRDGLVYVTDRSANRLQVFQRTGQFVREGFIAPENTDLGTAYGVALSQDPQQRWVYINDGSNNKIWILRRDNLQVVGSFSSYGRQGGQVMSAHSMAVDQRGNIYVGETRGRRVQRFRLVSGG